MRGETVRFAPVARLTVTTTVELPVSHPLRHIAESEQAPREGSADLGRVRDAGALDRLVECHAPAVAKLAHRMLGWRDDDVNDVVQDVFLAALRQLKNFRGEANVETWLTRITINVCRTHQRKSLLRWKLWRRTAHSAEPVANVASGHDETSQEVRRAVQSLKPRDREVIVLFYLEERTVKEIAELLDAKPNAIEVRLHRARLRLKDHLTNLLEK